MAGAYHGSHLQPPSTAAAVAAAATPAAAGDGSGTSTYRWAPVIQAKGQARNDLCVRLRLFVSGGSLAQGGCRRAGSSSGWWLAGVRVDARGSSRQACEDIRLAGRLSARGLTGVLVEPDFEARGEVGRVHRSGPAEDASALASPRAGRSSSTCLMRPLPMMAKGSRPRDRSSCRWLADGCRRAELDISCGRSVRPLSSAGPKGDLPSLTERGKGQAVCPSLWSSRRRPFPFPAAALCLLAALPPANYKKADGSVSSDLLLILLPFLPSPSAHHPPRSCFSPPTSFGHQPLALSLPPTPPVLANPRRPPSPSLRRCQPRPSLSRPSSRVRRSQPTAQTETTSSSSGSSRGRHECVASATRVRSPLRSSLSHPRGR